MKIKIVFLLFVFITQYAFANFTCDTSVFNYYSTYETNSYICNSGQYLPSNTLGCVQCLHGFTCNGGTYNFNKTRDQGIVASVYTCNYGYFLPADSDTCYICQNGFTCPGGTFEFNPKVFQGLSFESIPNNTMNNICADNFPVDLLAIYEPNVHTCSAGYYLPANIDECTKCLNDHYCPGGTFTFNETTPQGIIECPNNHPFAPAGMWLESQCGRKLHIGDDILYMHQQPVNPTTHRLFVKYGNTTYSANTTLSDIQMSVSTARKLKVVLENNIYSVFDDSMEQNH